LKVLPPLSVASVASPLASVPAAALAAVLVVACGAADSDRSPDPLPPGPALVVPEAPPPAAPPPAAPPERTRLDGSGFPDKVIALTWDDGPDASTLELASYLTAHRIAATFFVVASWIDGVSDDPGCGKDVFATGYENIPILGDLVAMGHRLGNHTLHHVVLRQAAGMATISRELRDNQRNVDPFLTNELRLFRAPGGGWGETAARVVDGDPYLTQLVGPVAWDVDRKDWDESLHCRGPRSAFECEPAAPGHALRMKPAVVAARYVASIEATGHGIVLLHDRVGHVGSTYGVEVAQAMIPQLQARGYVFAAPVLRFSPLRLRHHADMGDFSAAERWDPATLRVADVNGDRRADVCGRTPTGLRCAVSVVATGTLDRMPRTAFRTARRSGSSPRGGNGTPRDEAPAGALHLADITGDGQADVCVAAPGGIVCAAAGPVGELGRFRAWSSDDHADAVRFADVDGDGRADACGRGANGVTCARNVGGRFEHPRPWLAATTDARTGGSSTAQPLAGATVQLADVDGDGRADVCARGRRGVSCGLSTGRAFAHLERWSGGSDFAGDDTEGEVRFGDINGDGRDDVCARVRGGIACALSTGRAFTRATLWLTDDAARSEGFALDDLASTLQLGDVNGDGRDDVCARAVGGIVCGLAP